MNTEPAQTELMPSSPPPKSELLLAVEQSGLELETGQKLMASFQPLFDQAEGWRQKVAILCPEGVEPKPEDAPIARASRLALKKIRVDNDKKRKLLKEDVLRRGRAIDGIAHVVDFLIEPLEAKLEEVEKYAERKEQQRKEALKVQRNELLAPFGIDTSVYLLGEMSDDSFSSLLAGTKAAHEAKIEAARKVEQERIETENRRLAEEARILAENERLKKEADERAEADRLAKETADREAKEAAAKRAVLKAEREAILKPFEVDTTFIDLGNMLDADFLTLRGDSEASHQRILKERADVAEERRKAAEDAKIAAEQAAKAKAEREALEAKALADKQASDKAAKEAEEKLAAERAESATRELKARQQERARADKADADAKAAREAQEKAEDDLKAQRDAEAARVAKIEADKKAAALAPDADKIRALAIAVRSLSAPDLATDEGKAVASKITEQIDKFAKWLDAEANKISQPATEIF